MHPITIVLLIVPLGFALTLLGLHTWFHLLQRLSRKRPWLPATLIIVFSIVLGLTWSIIGDYEIVFPTIVILIVTGLFRLTVYPFLKDLAIK